VAGKVAGKVAAAQRSVAKKAAAIAKKDAAIKNGIKRKILRTKAARKTIRTVNKVKRNKFVRNTVAARKEAKAIKAGTMEGGKFNAKKASNYAVERLHQATSKEAAEAAAKKAAKRAAAGGSRHTVRLSVKHAAKATKMRERVHSATTGIIESKKLAGHVKDVATAAKALKGGNAWDKVKNANAIYNGMKASRDIAAKGLRVGASTTKSALQKIATTKANKLSGKAASKILSSSAKTKAKALALRHAAAETTVGQTAIAANAAAKETAKHASVAAEQALKVHAAGESVKSNSQAIVEEVKGLKPGEGQDEQDQQ
jgi:histone H1/5